MDTVRETVSGWLETLSTRMESWEGWAALGVAVLLYAFAFARIFAKAGFHPALGLSMLVPPLPLLLPLFLAFLRWPAERELRSLRRVQRAVHRADNRHLAKSA